VSVTISRRLPSPARLPQIAVYGDLNQLIAVYGDLNQLIAVHGDLTQLIAVHGDLAQPVVAVYRERARWTR